MKLSISRFFAKKLTRMLSVLLTCVLLACLLAACDDPAKPRKGDDPTSTPTPAAGEATPTTAPDTTPTDVPDVTPTDVPDATPTTAPDATPTDVPDATPTTAPDATPTTAPDATPTTAPEATATPTTAPTATPTTAPTATPTTAPTATPTNTPKPTATPTPAFGKKMSDFEGGQWYAYDFMGVESPSKPMLCKNDPGGDYRLIFSGNTVRFINTADHLIDSFLADSWHYELMTNIGNKTRAMYESMGHNMIDYINDPTDLSRGHLLYCCNQADESTFMGLMIVDAQPNGTLKVKFRQVNGDTYNWSDFTFTRTPVFDEPNTYDHYVGQWYAELIWGVEAEGPEKCSTDPKKDYRLTISKDKTATLVWAPDHDPSAGTTEHFELRTSFSKAEYMEYAEWFNLADDYLDKKGTDLNKGQLLFCCTDAKWKGALLLVEWSLDGRLIVHYTYYMKEASYPVNVEYQFTKNKVY